MLNIFICEDDCNQRNYISDTVAKVVLMENYDLSLKLVTANPYELLENICETETGIYFLDIDLSCDMNGLSLAQEIRKKDKRGFIVFVTTHSEMSYMTFSYKVEAMDFILKDNPDEMKIKIKQCIVDAYKRYSSPQNLDSKVFKYAIGDKEYCIKMKDITYIETSDTPHKLVLHSSNCIQEIQGVLKDVLELLDDNFYMIHRSFIVNKEYIQTINVKDKIVNMKDGSVCFMSRNRIKELLL